MAWSICFDKYELPPLISSSIRLLKPENPSQARASTSKPERDKGWGRETSCGQMLILNYYPKSPLSHQDKDHLSGKPLDFSLMLFNLFLDKAVGNLQVLPFLLISELGSLLHLSSFCS